MNIVEGCCDRIPNKAMWHWCEQTLVVGLCWPFTVISLIFLVFSSIHFSRRIFSVALINSFSFLISYVEKERNGRRVKQKDKTWVMAGHYVCLMGYCKEMLHKSGNSVVIFSKSFDSKLWICVLLEHRRRKCAECTGHVHCLITVNGLWCFLVLKRCKNTKVIGQLWLKNLNMWTLMRE